MSSDIRDNRIDANNLGGSGLETANRLSGFHGTAELILEWPSETGPFAAEQIWKVNMKMVKSLFLGSAAGLIAMGGAQAADLPVKAKAVEYVKICSLYGAGFYYIPGTDTCIKLGGYLRAEIALNTNCNYNGAYTASPVRSNRLTQLLLHARSREDLNIDTRTATEYGVVRTYFDAMFTWTTGNYAGTGTAGTVYARLRRHGCRPTPSDGSAPTAARRFARRVLCLHPVRRLHDG